MNTQKVAITIPRRLLTMIDAASLEQGLSRSRYISNILKEKVDEDRNRSLKEAYDRVFSDDSIRKEQIETIRWFESIESKEGMEW